MTVHNEPLLFDNVTIPNDVYVREMTEDDVEEAAVIEGKTFSMPWKASDFLEMVKAPYAYYFVAEIPQRKIVGIIGLRDIAGEGEITNVAVDKSYRRLGIGRKLMDAVIDKCDELKINDITLEVRVSNVPAIRLYESYGFVSEGVRPNFYEHPTEDAAIYWKRKRRNKN